TTLAVKSILIAKKDIDKEIIYEITRLLYENYQDLDFPKGLEKSKDAFSANPLNAWHAGTQAFFETENIKPSIVSDSDSYVLYVVFSIFLIVPLVLFIIFSILYGADMFFTTDSQHAFIDSIKMLYLKLLNYKYILFFAIMFMLYLICIFLVKYFEHTWAIQHNVFSSFDNIPLYKSLLWLFVFAMSGFNDSIFPHSNEGKFIVSLIPMIGLGGILALAGLITSDQIKKYFLEAKGMGRRKDRNHIILCGWNDNAHFIVENLLHKNISVKKKIVILADLEDKDKIEQFEFDKRYVSYVSGNAGSRNDLERANFVEADMAIVVPNGHSEDRDARVILNVLTIEKFCLELEESGERSKLNIHTIAQISDAKNEQIAQDAGVDQIISLGNIESKIFTQAVHNPGVAKFVNEVFTYNDLNDIYSLPITENSTLFDKTYDEILSMLREHKILLLSINIEFRKNTNDVKDILKEAKLSKAIITNPFDEHELAYRTKKDDLLIVLAQYEENIIKAVKELEIIK
ncbi:MAG: NAD-binding protein, partial [Bacteroidales bacterium]|nr:NAD-binding protein [Bacteroidales bacterium]